MNEENDSAIIHALVTLLREQASAIGEFVEALTTIQKSLLKLASSLESE